MYLAVFMTALSTTALEVLLPRIWSVSMWYHFAFVAIAVAMCGMTGGALLVFYCPVYFRQERVSINLSLFSLVFSISTVVSFLTQLSIPFFLDLSIVGIYSILLIYLVVSLPFFFVGIVTALALTKFPDHIGKIYAFDLFGAAIGCLSIFWLLRLADGPTAVIFAALISSMAAVIFSLDSGSKELRWTSVILSIVLVLFTVGNTIAVHQQSSLLRPIWVNGQFEERPLYVKWSSLARIAVFGDPDAYVTPFGFSLSQSYPADRKVKQLDLYIDSVGSSVIPHFDGNLAAVDYLKYDLPALVHYLRKNASVLVIGVGGGRDVLTALVFGQKSVTGIELNSDMLAAVTERFGDFSGHLDKDAKVRFINDEARSFLARSKSQYDIIQIAAISPSTAMAHGAFALTENALYTIDGWKTIIQRLAPDGILTCTYFAPQHPAETYRYVALSRSVLLQLGVTDPRKCMVIVKPKGDSTWATLLLSRSPLAKSDLKTLTDVTHSLNYDIELSPVSAADPILADIANGANEKAIARQLPTRIDAPTDDSPFFLYLSKPGQAYALHSPRAKRGLYATAEVVLFDLALAVVTLSILVMIVPLLAVSPREVYRKALPDLFYFALIGLGFMFVEISQLQRLIIFLGHPSYSLSVVLATLLVSAGIGSYLTNFLKSTRVKNVLDSEDQIRQSVERAAIYSLTLLLFLFAGYGLMTPAVLSHFISSPTPARIGVSIVILCPLGLLMGTAMPFGLRLASNRNASLTPWFWAVNGATSVCASVLAVVMAIVWSISSAYWLGAICYFAALVTLLIANRQAKFIEKLWQDRG